MFYIDYLKKPVSFGIRTFVPDVVRLCSSLSYCIHPKPWGSSPLSVRDTADHVLASPVKIPCLNTLALSAEHVCLAPHIRVQRNQSNYSSVPEPRLSRRMTAQCRSHITEPYGTDAQQVCRSPQWVCCSSRSHSPRGTPPPCCEGTNQTQTPISMIHYFSCNWTIPRRMRHSY